MVKFLRYYNSSVSIIIFAILGILFGLIFGNLVSHIKPLGDIFIALIKMMIIPIIFFTIISSTSALSKTHKAVKIGTFSMLYFFTTSFLSAIIGIAITLILKPGFGIENLPSRFFATSIEITEISGMVKPLNPLDFLLGIIPSNLLQAITTGNLIQVLFFAIFLGIGLAYVNNNNKDKLIEVVEVINDVLLWMISKIMFIAPIAVFSLMSYLVSTVGLEILFLVGKLFLAVLIAGIIWVYIGLGGIVSLFSKVSYFRFFKAILPLKLIAFSTSSSLVSLPTNIKICKNMGVSNKIVSFVLPVAANLNMNGSSLFYSVVTVFFAQMFGVEISLTTYFLIALMATIGSMATPGIPGLPLIVVMVMLIADVPLVALPLVFAVDRILDMFITTINVVGDASAAVVMDKVIDNNI